MPVSSPSLFDDLLSAADEALRTVGGANRSQRPTPTPRRDDEGPTLSDGERRLSGALMRVNHVGEVCAQALYSAQALATRNPALRRQFEQAAREAVSYTHLTLPTKRIV